jgi:hypothetical protein
MWKNISAGECVGDCVVIAEECVSKCSVFEEKKDCAEEYCSWEESECRIKCASLTEIECGAYDGCFWLLGGAGTSEDARCIEDVRGREGRKGAREGGVFERWEMKIVKEERRRD